MPGGSWAYTILSPARSIARRCRSQGRDAFPPGGKYYVCGGLNYRRASEETTDECLTEIFQELSRDEYRHARQILTLLEKQMSI